MVGSALCVDLSLFADARGVHHPAQPLLAEAGHHSRPQQGAEEEQTRVLRMCALTADIHTLYMHNAYLSQWTGHITLQLLNLMLFLFLSSYQLILPLCLPPFPFSPSLLPAQLDHHGV